MWLTLRSGALTGKRFLIEAERYVVGRDDRCDLPLPDEKVSWRHASLAPRPDGTVELRDLASTNGTYVDGRRIDGPVVLSGGEQLQFGDTVITTSREDDAGAPIQRPDATATRSPGPATIERRILRRTANRAIVLASASIVVAVALVASFATGLIGTKGGAPSIADIVEAVAPSTVLILAEMDGQAVSSGTGWVLDAGEGLIVTNAHVVNGGESFVVGVSNMIRPAEIVAVAPCEDLAVLKVADASGLRTLPLGSQSNLRRGDTVVAVGFPTNASLQATLQATTGVVSVVRERFNVATVDVPRYPNVIQTTAAINPGNSGGPLVDTEGRLVGVSSAGITEIGGRTIQGQGYAIGVDHARSVLAEMRRGRSIAWTGMGFSYPTTPQDASAFGLPAESGLVVARAVQGSPAQEAGLGTSPALLIAVNGEPLDNTLASYCAAVGQAKPGESATFTLIEQGDGEEREIEIRFA